ncbi:hypothetical protein SAMN04488134_10188 [Amphibacillus marinus]|uniref:YpoC-like domain-containing protein n=1 Tax=Amphibacillus marinus TaxID=872970 RepID=A0A1H8GK99_9BACI|nr:hypothetical protein [Amphibacillus marinus]SEN44184.1 hypothetical protein SAMN04488134_10188 [Amphibacillus marinus]
MSRFHTDLFQAWKKKSPEIGLLFREKKYQQAVSPMQSNLKQFKQALALLNGTDESVLDVNTLKHKPINVVERMLYIEENLSQYHAFIQLQALYEELEKLYAKVAILEAYQE